MLFGGCQDKDGVFRRFFQGFEEGVEGRLRKHVYLVDDVDFVLAYLWGYAYLVDKVTDIVYRVIGSRIELENIKGEILVFPFSAVLVDFFRQNTGASGFANASGATKKKGLGQVVVLYGIGKGVGNGLLPNNILEGLGSVLACRYYKRFQ